MADAGLQEMLKWMCEWARSFQSEEELDLAIETVLGLQVSVVWVTVRW